MNPRRPDAQDDDTNIVDEFGRGKQKIIITDDLPRDPLQMFQSEFDQDETDPPAARLHIPEHPAMRPTASRDLVTLLMARLGRQRSGPRSVSTVSIVTISMILLGGALLNRGDVLALLDNLVFGRDDTLPVLEVRPPADVTQVAAAAPATNGTIDRVSARPSTPTPVTATKRPSKVQQPRQPARNLVANVIPRTRVRETAPPRSGPGSVASFATTPSPLPATLDRERLAPRGEERPAVAPAPSLPPLAAAVATPAAPALSAAPLITTPTPSPASLAPPAGRTEDTRAVAVVLNRYQLAFSAMDVGAAAAVWPSVDVKALAKAFEQLEEQTFDLEGCNITIAGVRAEAECAGNARYIRKVGSRALRVEPRHWRFRLRQANDDWVIDAVDAR